MTCEPIRFLGVAPAAILALVLLAACSSTPPAPGSDSESGQLDEGSVLVLLKPLSVPGDVWSVYFQNGELMRFGAVDDSRVYCELYLNGAKGEAWQVVPQRLLIERIDLSSDDSSWSAIPPRGGVVLARDPRQTLYKTVLSLRSEVQPEVRELRCQVLYDSGWNAYPGEGQIRRALGDYFSLVRVADASEGAEDG